MSLKTFQIEPAQPKLGGKNKKVLTHQSHVIEYADTCGQAQVCSGVIRRVVGRAERGAPEPPRATFNQPRSIRMDRGEFPAQNGEHKKNVRTRSNSLDDRTHSYLILPEPAGTTCASQDRATQRCDFSRIAAGKTIFLHLRSLT